METSPEIRARARIGIINSHIAPLQERLCREKNKNVGRACLGVCLGGLAGVLAWKVEGAAIVAAAPSIILSSGAVARHVTRIVPLDRKIGGFIQEAQDIADEAGVEFETNYIPPRERLLGRTLIRLGLRK